MKKEDLCHGTLKVVEWIGDKKIEVQGTWFSLNLRPLNIKRKRLTCPKCGRRLLSSVYTDEDIDYIYHSIPPHKPKHWWKKPKKNKHKERNIR